MMDELTQKTVKAVEGSQVAYCKTITANDTNIRSNQRGYYIHQEAYMIAFTSKPERDTKLKKNVLIRWQDDFETKSIFTYYSSKNEYRLTGFGYGFPFRTDERIGDLLVLCKQDEGYYFAFVLHTDQQIEDFVAFFDLSLTNGWAVINDRQRLLSNLNSEIVTYINAFSDETFPDTQSIALHARTIYEKCTGHNERWLVNSPDSEIAARYDMEYDLFKALEDKIYAPFVSEPLGSVEKLAEIANSVLNRRKSRAGRALERQLEHIFDVNHLPYSSQKKTEGREKPDFIMPSIEAYRIAPEVNNNLIMLASKKTCKDRWRQVLEEAEKVKHKHIFTLQQSISSNQLTAMRKANLTVVIPAQNKKYFPKEHQEELMTLKNFLRFAKEKLSLI